MPETGTSMLRVPLSPEEFRPPRSSDLVTDAANFLRAHWEEVLPSFQMISGESPSEHGLLAFDEAACAFKIKEIAGQNGFSALASVSTYKLWRALRHGYKRNTGVAMHRLEEQNHRLRLEHRAEIAAQTAQTGQPKPRKRRGK